MAPELPTILRWRDNSQLLVTRTPAGKMNQDLTVSLVDIKLSISGSCPIVVLTTVLGRLRRADPKNMSKNVAKLWLNIIRGQLLPEKMRFENT